MTWFFLSLIAILFWSGSDLFSKMGSKPQDVYSHWKMVMAVGLVMGVHAVFMLLTGTPFRLADIVTYLPASLLYILSMVLGYAGLRYIELSVSSPICNSSGAVAALLCFVFLHETMSGLQFFAVVLVCAGVFALSVLEKRQNDTLQNGARRDDTPQNGVRRDDASQSGARQAQANSDANRKYTRSFLAVLFPILYCILDGLGTFADALLLDTAIGEEQANIAYELTFFLMAAAAFVYVVLVKKQTLHLPDEKPKLAAALCETAGQFAYVFAIGANAIVAAPMISSYCVVSLLWSRLFLKEKLSGAQYAVIAMAAVGIAILGME